MGIGPEGGTPSPSSMAIENNKVSPSRIASIAGVS
jgi:hypothetical protein